MRIAIFEPQPRVCGPVTSMTHLHAGLVALGHDVDLVSFTKSGRTKKHWGAHDDLPLGCGWSIATPNVVEKFANAVDVLDSYDAIILTEPKNSHFDKEALRNEWTRPVYADWLNETSTPWTTALHGAQYDVKRAPWLQQLFSSPSWTGRGVSYGLWVSFPDSDETGTLNDFEWVTAPLPFITPMEPTWMNHGRGVVGTVGRIAPNKGQQTLAWLPLFTPVDIEIWGACSKGLGPNYTYLMWEFLGKTDNTELIWRDAPLDEDGKPKHAPLNPFPWHARVNGRNVWYRGNYYDDRPFKTFDVAVNLTSPRFSSGLTEFATLEAVVSGKRLVTNRNVWWPDYRSAVVDFVPPSPDYMAKGRADEELKDLARAVEEAQLIPDSQLRENFALVRERHDPAKIAASFIECLN